MRYSRTDLLKQVAALSLAAPTSLLTLSCRSRAPASSEQSITGHATSLLFEHDGVGLAELIRTRQITSTELVEEVLGQIEALNPSINAVVQTLFDPELAFDRAGQTLGQGPLAGVPVMLKNLTDYRAAKIDFGSRLYARAYARGGGPDPESSAIADAI